MTIHQFLRLILLCLCLPHFCSPEITFRKTPVPQQRTLGARVSRSDGKILHRQKRGWMWTQFFLLEEYTGSDYQYVGKLHSDQDKGDGSLKYILSGDGAGTLFIIDEKTGDFHATRRIDREEKAFYTLCAQAINRRTLRPVEPESEFVIKIHDINDNEPTFPEEIYTASVPEMSVVGTSVVQVTATDADDPSYGNSARVIYSILQGQPYFSVEPETGILRTALPNMNRENREQYQVVIQAKDMGGQMGGLSGTTTVNITLTDVNDNPPRFPQNTIHLRVLESSPVGTAVGSVKATNADTGKNAEVEYRIIDGDGTDTFDIITEKETQEGIITVKKPLDYESRLYTQKVEAENTHVDTRFYYLGPFKDTTIVKISIEDIDEPPVFSRSSYLFEVHEDIEVGTIIGTVMARDPDSASSPIRKLCLFSLDRYIDLDRIFSIHSGNGSLYTSKPLDRELSQWHNLTVIAAEIKISAVHKDDPLGGQKFFFSLAAVNPNFTVQDNEVIVVLFAALKRQRKKEPLILSKEDIRKNIVSYNDEGGGEENTQAFDIGTLRNPAAIEEKKLRRDIMPEALFIPRRTPTAPDNTDVRDFIAKRLKEHDLDPTTPPYDSLATYAYEGNYSVAESLSSLESGTTEGDQNYDYPREWGPRLNKLTEMYGCGDSDKDS
ncbi:LOW QUALITY PROTEIN: cadherin-10-like [Callospermophilus lateralis]